MLRRIAYILLLPSLVFAASPAIITVVGPAAPQVGIQTTSTVITPTSVTVNAAVTMQTTGTAVVEVPGPQGPAGSGVFQNLSGYARKEAFSLLSSATAAKLAGKQPIGDYAVQRQAAIFPRVSTNYLATDSAQSTNFYTNRIDLYLPGGPSQGGYLSSNTLSLGNDPNHTTTVTPYGVTTKDNLTTYRVIASQIGDGSGSSALTSLIISHPTDHNNPHQVVPAQIFSNHTGNRYPLFDASNAYTWKKPLEACVDIFDGAPGVQGERGFRGYSGHSPALTWSGDQIAIDGSITGPHLTGPAGSVTEAQVRALLATKGTGNLQQQGNADSDVKVEMLYSGGGTSLWITSGGLIFAKDSAGKITWGWDNVNKLMVFSNFSYSSTRKSATIDRFGQTTRYATDGRTVIYRDYTSGKAIWYSKSGRVVMKRYTGALIL